MTAPGRFTDRVTPAGHRLVLVGANGEDVVSSEHHPTRDGSAESLEVIVRTVLAAAFGDTDEVTMGSPYVSAVTLRLMELGREDSP